jgi:hypothetical protein
MNLLLIEKSLSSIVKHLKDTDHIIFDKGQDYQELLSKVQEKTYINVGIFSHGNSFSFNFIEDVIATSENTNFSNFLADLNNKTNFKNLDIFACNFGSNNSFINKLENELNINVRASTDNTGNKPFGNWIMETDNKNIKEIYFNETISNFKELLWTVRMGFLSNINEINDGKNIIYSNGYAFAALKDNGSVVTWGLSGDGGDSTGVSGQLQSDVKKIYSTESAFAALKDNGSVVTWGLSGDGGDSTGVSGQLQSDVKKIYSTEAAFAALKDNGSVVTWGEPTYGGIPSYDKNGTIVDVSDKLQSGVEKIYSNVYAFAALKDGGSVVTWGEATVGGDSRDVSGKLQSGVEKIYSNDYAFAALKDGGSVVTWGEATVGGDSRDVSSKLQSGVEKIYSTEAAFAALKDNGSVVTWGEPTYGGDSRDVSGKLQSGVKKIYSNTGAFAALKDGGSVVTWGEATFGGDSRDVSGKLQSGVEKIYSTYGSFAAVKSDGSVVTWGEDITNFSTNLILKTTGYDITHLTDTQVNDNSILLDYPSFASVDYIPTAQATASGDPYISTLCGKKFKLPNSTKIYRMAETTYNNKQLIVNASVSQLTEQEITFLKKFASKITNRRPVTNGYFFDKFFISYGNKYAIFNRNIELLETNITQNDTEFSINFNNELKDFSCPLQLQGKCKQKETNIKIADKITINLLNIFNPQIINGVEFNYNGNNDNIEGVFNTFYHPKNYVIKQIDNTKPIKLKTNLPEYKKHISDKFDLLL